MAPPADVSEDGRTPHRPRQCWEAQENRQSGGRGCGGAFPCTGRPSWESPPESDTFTTPLSFGSPVPPCKAPWHRRGYVQPFSFTVQGQTRSICRRGHSYNQCWGPAGADPFQWKTPVGEFLRHHHSTEEEKEDGNALFAWVKPAVASAKTALPSPSAELVLQQEAPG
jgi:hypothetical protein